MQKQSDFLSKQPFKHLKQARNAISGNEAPRIRDQKLQFWIVCIYGRKLCEMHGVRHSHWLTFVMVSPITLSAQYRNKSSLKKGNLDGPGVVKSQKELFNPVKVAQWLWLDQFWGHTHHLSHQKLTSGVLTQDFGQEGLPGLKIGEIQRQYCEKQILWSICVFLALKISSKTATKLNSGTQNETSWNFSCWNFLLNPSHPGF